MEAPASARRSSNRRTVKVEIELAHDLARLAVALARPPQKRAINERLMDAMDDLGLPVIPDVKVSTGSSARPIHVRIYGSSLPFEPELLRRVWIATMPNEHCDAAFVAIESGGFPFGWLPAWVQKQSASDNPDFAPCTIFIGTLAAEIVRLNGGLIVTDDLVQAYLARAGSPSRDEARIHEITELFRVLFDAGLSVANQRKVTAQLASVGRSWLSTEERAEAFLELAHPVETEVHGDFATLERLVGIDASAAAGSHTPISRSTEEAWTAVAGDVYKQLGVRLPPLAFVPDRAIPPGQIAIRVAHQISAAYVGPPPGMVVVNDKPENLAVTFAINTSPCLHPSSAAGFAFAPASEAERLRKAGKGVLTPVEWLMRAVQQELSMKPFAVLRLRQVMVELGLMLDSFPELVRITLSVRTPREIAATLRTLMRERVSVRDLRSILEQMALSAALPSHLGALADLRRGIRGQLVDEAGHHTGKLAYFRIDPAIGSWALSAWRSPRGYADPSSEKSVVAVLDAIWAVILPFHPSLPPAIVASDRARPAIRALTEREMPLVPVLAESEIADFKAAQEVAVINSPLAVQRGRNGRQAERENQTTGIRKRRPVPEID